MIGTPVFHQANLFARTDKKLEAILRFCSEFFVDQSHHRTSDFASRRANKFAYCLVREYFPLGEFVRANYKSCNGIGDFGFRYASRERIHVVASQNLSNESAISFSVTNEFGLTLNSKPKIYLGANTGLILWPIASTAQRANVQNKRVK